MKNFLSNLLMFDGIIGLSLSTILFLYTFGGIANNYFPIIAETAGVFAGVVLFVLFFISIFLLMMSSISKIYDFKEVLRGKNVILKILLILNLIIGVLFIPSLFFFLIFYEKILVFKN